MDNFEDFANMTIAASPILTDVEIDRALYAKDTERLFKYAYRIAAFVTVYCRAKAPSQTDDTDWQDAVQECMAQFPALLERYDVSKAPFLKYMSQNFQFIIRRYLWTLANGGTGSSDTDAQPPLSMDALDSTYYDSDAEIEEVYENVPESTAFGTRDPLIELLAAESVKEALLLIASMPNPRRKGPGAIHRALHA